MIKRLVKNRIIVLSIAIVLILTMLLFTAGCNRSEATAEGLKTGANPPVEQKANDHSVNLPPENEEASSDALSPTEKAEGLIGEAAARQKAFTHAGVSEKEVTLERVKLDKDDGRFEYEVDFRVGNTEYEYDIDALTGEVRESDRDREGNKEKGNAVSSKIDSAKGVTAEKALEIALAHAGVSKEKAVMDRVETDFENGKKIYEVEFYSAGYDYDYDIDAETGKVLRFEKEYYD
ncbi:MAG: PepSY domain-containing protein [Clostridia bacterium]|nr:PepSY domain-containing protein [Clostridia bacterium]